jgi:hypothetical protein
LGRVFAEALQESAQGYPLCPPAAVESSELPVGNSAAPQTDAVPGNFVSAQYESDCARFVSEAKTLAHRRASALERALAAV